ncbi:MAG: carboxypeptidase-like regulatory domain-containing protein [Mangrovibacterium sp.]
MKKDDLHQQGVWNRNALLKKIWRTMKLTGLFMLISFIAISAGTYSQNAHFSFTIENGTLHELFLYLEQNSNFRFAYNKSDLDDMQRVSYKFQNESVEQILDRVLDTEKLSFSVKNEYIIITSKRGIERGPINTYTNQPKSTVSGIVTGFSGASIPGVTVTIKGTEMGTVTDADGKYILKNVPESAVLVFSFVGMAKQEVPVEGKSTINVTLLDETIGIEEVVAIGYGSIKKKDLTSSVTTVTSKDFNVGTHTNVMQVLQGKVPGLNITKDGNPTGATAVMLRGPSTLRIGEAQQPLYVVDGVPGGILGSLDDIVSIDVLRDASATAIYGSKAANGVIIITTKRGEAGNTKISYNGYVGIETISNKIDMMSADEYRSFLTKNNLSVSPKDEDNAKTDWMDEVTRIGVSHNNNLSIGGGTDKTTYFSSLTYKKVEGIIKETGVKHCFVDGECKTKGHERPSENRLDHYSQYVRFKDSPGI